MEEKLSPADWGNIQSALRGAWLRSKRVDGRTIPNPEELQRLIRITNGLSDHPLAEEGMEGLEEYHLHMQKMRAKGIFVGD